MSTLHQQIKSLFFGFTKGSGGDTITAAVGAQEAARQGVPVFFYGSKPEVLEKLCERMQKLCPGLQIAGARPSQFRCVTDEEQKTAAEQIRDSGARLPTLLPTLGRLSESGIGGLSYLAVPHP